MTYQTVAEATCGLGRYSAFYNCQRPHHALGYSVPAQVYGSDVGMVDCSLRCVDLGDGSAEEIYPFGPGNVERFIIPAISDRSSAVSTFIFRSISRALSKCCLA